MPNARNLLVAPMIADGRPIGAIVVESAHGRRLPGVERRVASMVARFASMAALNLRNAVLLRHVQDLAERDALTGAANRRMFQVSLERTLEAAEPKGRKDMITTILFIDLDDFKVVNDTLGHAAGDALLVAVTERISNLVRSTDLVARLGGDEFAILTEDEPDLARSRAMAERLVQELRAPYVIADSPGGRHLEHRHRERPRRGGRRDRPRAQRRRRDVHGQGQRQERLRHLRSRACTSRSASGTS